MYDTVTEAVCAYLPLINILVRVYIICLRVYRKDTAFLKSY